MFDSIMNILWALHMPVLHKLLYKTVHSIPRVLIMLGFELWICKGYTDFCVNFLLRIHSVLSILSSEYAKVLNK